jgi:hypothetical protein
LSCNSFRAQKEGEGFGVEADHLETGPPKSLITLYKTPLWRGGRQYLAYGGTYGMPSRTGTYSSTLSLLALAGSGTNSFGF